MSDRIKLTVDNIKLDISNYHKFEIIIFDKLNNKIKAEKLKKQILDEHSFYENHAKCSFESMGECCPYREKAEKYDACSNLINQVNELLQENRQLEELLSDTTMELGQVTGQRDNLQKKLEKINELVIDEACGNVDVLTLPKELKEILGDKQ